MGKRSKERQLVASAGRRRPVLQINRVSRREVSEAVPKPSGNIAINPTSITGIGLLGAYGGHSDDDDDDDDDDNDEDNKNNQQARNSNDAMETQLADFFMEIQSMEAESNPSVTQDQDGTVNQPKQDEPAAYQEKTEAADNDYQAEEDPNYPWQACLDSNSNSYYYWNVETNEVQWEPPPEFQFPQTDSYIDEAYPSEDQQGVFSTTSSVSYDAGPSEQDINESDYEKDSEDADEISIGPTTVLPSSVRKNVFEEPGNDSKAVVDEQPDENDDDDDDNDDNDDDVKLSHDTGKSDVFDGYPLLACPNTEQDSSPSTTEIRKKRESEPLTDKSLIKKPKLAENEDSVDDFAEQLLEDTYDQGQKDTLSEDNMEMSDEETEQKTDEKLLPPEVFQHIDSPVEDNKNLAISAPLTDERKVSLYTAAEEEEFRSKIIEKSAILSNKLDFLNVSTKGISTLHVLFIEMETRIRDWREGALDSQHLVRKLQDADEQIKKYEESAVPPGWSCHWDRKHKRYYYTNHDTQQSQWDFPADELKEKEQGTVQAAASVGTMATTMSTSMTQATLNMATPLVQTWNTMAGLMPVNNSAVQVPMMPMVMTTASLTSTLPVIGPEHYYTGTPPAPGTENGESVTFSTSTTYDPPPPPPGTDDLPPLPPGESAPPPPPPPPPAPPEEIPPPPPEDDDPDPSVSQNIQSIRTKAPSALPVSSSAVFMAAGPNSTSGRSLIDYSDLEIQASSPVPGNPSELAASTQSGTASPIPPAQGAAAKPPGKKKKKSKGKMFGTTLSSKVRKVSSLVQKWQSIEQQQVEPELMDSSEEEEEDREVVNQRMIEEWKINQMQSGKAALNPNFEEVKGDWRERLKIKKYGDSSTQS